MEMMGRRYNKRLDWQGSGGVNDSSKREEDLQRRTGLRSSAMKTENDGKDIMCIYRLVQFAKPSGVAWICCKEGQSWKLCHGALTVDFRAGCSSCSMTNSFVTKCNTGRKSCELLTSAPADLADYTV